MDNRSQGYNAIRGETIKYKIIIMWLMLMLAAAQANALGIVSDYLPGNTLELRPGEVKEYGIRLQNPDEETKAKLTVYSDSSIAEVIGYKEIYTLPKGSTPIKIRVKAPGDAKPNTFYTVGISLEASSSDAGIVQFATKVSKDFRVKIAGEEKAEPSAPGNTENKGRKNLFIYSLIGLLVLGIIIYFLRKNKLH